MVCTLSKVHQELMRWHPKTLNGSSINTENKNVVEKGMNEENVATGITLLESPHSFCNTASNTATNASNMYTTSILFLHNNLELYDINKRKNRFFILSRKCGFYNLNIYSSSCNNPLVLPFKNHIKF